MQTSLPQKSAKSTLSRQILDKYRRRPKRAIATPAAGICNVRPTTHNAIATLDANVLRRATYWPAGEYRPTTRRLLAIQSLKLLCYRAADGKTQVDWAAKKIQFLKMPTGGF